LLILREEFDTERALFKEGDDADVGIRDFGKVLI